MIAMIWRFYVLIEAITIITVKNIDYCCIIHNISKPEAINLSGNSVLEDCGYIKKHCQTFGFDILNMKTAKLLKKR